MNKNFIKINNKNVQISQPYNAAAPPLIGREQEMRKILAAWMVGNSWASAVAPAAVRARDREEPYNL